MRVLVLGGTAFIGPHVVARLRALDHEITLFHRGRTEADLPADVPHIHGDRRQLLDFTDPLRSLSPDVVLDMIPMTEQDAQAVMNVFAGFARRVVAISSVDVYRAYDVLRGKESGPVDAIPLTEEASLRPHLFPYREDTPRAPDDPMNWADDYEKILVERAVTGDPRLPGTVLRLPAVYGPGDRQHRLFQHLKRMDDHRPAILLEEGQARWRWSLGYVEDVAAAIALAVADERAAGRIYNVAEPQSLSEAEWVRAIGQAAGWAGEVLTLPKEQLPPPLQSENNWDQHLVVDTTRIRQELAYAESISPDEALRRTVAWERAHPPATIDPEQFNYADEDVVLARGSTGV
jgi:nucleoside-diphosphate-sugar epimerase